MTDPDIIAEAEEYCRDAGIKPSTLSVRALNNSRYFDQLRRRLARFEVEVRKLRDFMAQHPPKVSGDE